MTAVGPHPCAREFLRQDVTRAIAGVRHYQATLLAHAGQYIAETAGCGTRNDTALIRQMCMA
jgi:hypothetical protein